MFGLKGSARCGVTLTKSTMARKRRHLSLGRQTTTPTASFDPPSRLSRPPAFGGRFGFRLRPSGLSRPLARVLAVKYILPLFDRYVFDGAKGTPYLEDDLPKPINAYGRSKLAGELAIRQSGPACIIFRTSWIFAARGRNFLRTVLRLSREKAELKIVADQVGAPTWARNIADFTAHAIRQVLRERDQNTFVSEHFHLSASGSTSWHAFAAAILEEAGCNDLLPSVLPRLIAIRSQEYPHRVQRPPKSCLATDRAAARSNIAMPDWRRGLTICMQEIQSAFSCER
jgi:dTDP-4-dehydrorhamnose reductase